MWHWNTLWAPAPGDPPAVDDPKLWRTPWTSEQALAVQTRNWDTLVTASRAWWSFWLAAMPLPGAQPVGTVPPAEANEEDPVAEPAPRRASGAARAPRAAKRSSTSRRVAAPKS